MDLLYIKARENLLTAGSDDCQEFFVKNNCLLELAYYNLFHQDTLNARKIFLSLTDFDIRAHWGAFITSICDKNVSGYPSYLELRNFFEIDFNIMFNYYLGDYIEEICKYADWFVTINPEVYKYIGRVFIKNKYPDFGLFFLERGVNFFYNDPELHYLFAEYYLSVSDNSNAKKYAESCLKVLPEYYPAEKIFDELT